MKHDFFKDEAKIDKYEKENGLGIYAEPEKPAKKENTEIEEQAEETEEQVEETEEQAEEPAENTESEDKE